MPNGSLWLILSATPQNPSSIVFIREFFRPLPYISYEIDYAERAGTLRVRNDCVGIAHRAVFVRNGISFRVPTVSPGIEPSIRSLRCILPLPFMGQTLACPGRVRPRILQRDPRNRLTVPARWEVAVLPVAQKIKIILRMVVSRIQKPFELCIRHRTFVDPERIDVHGMIVETSRSVFPGILDVYTYVVEAFNLNTFHTKLELCGRNPDHVRRRGR